MQVDASRLAGRYAVLACVTHALRISLSLVPALRTVSLLDGDANSYLFPARNLVERGIFSREFSAPYLWEPYRAPGYPLCIAVSMKLFGDFQKQDPAELIPHGGDVFVCIARLERAEFTFHRDPRGQVDRVRIVQRDVELSAERVERGSDGR